jgi:hypothetical protein
MTMSVCWRCGLKLDDTAAPCPSCGALREARPAGSGNETAAGPACAPAPPRPEGAQGVYLPYHSDCAFKKSIGAVSASSMALALVSLFFNYYGLVGLAAAGLGVIACLRANSRNTRAGKGTAIVAIVLGLISSVYMYMIGLPLFGMIY